MTPDLEHARAFIAALTGNVDTSVTFQTFADCSESGDRKRDRSLARVLHSRLSECAEPLADLNRRGAGIFVTVNETNLQGRKKQNIVALRALFSDFDAGDPDRPYALEPSFQVRSKRGPQTYWLLRPGEPLDAFKPAQEQLAAFYGSDPSIKDLSRVMRLPGFFHRKQEPFLVRFEPGSDRSYTIEEALAFHPTEDPTLTGSKGQEGSEKPERISAGRRNITLTSRAGSLRRLGFSPQEIKAALLVMNRERCDPPLPETEVLGIAESVGRYPAGATGVLTLEKGSDIWNSHYFVERHKDNLIFVLKRETWYEWTERHWADRSDLEIDELAKRDVEALFDLAKTLPTDDDRKKLREHALLSSKGPRVREMVRLSRGDPAFVRRLSDLDRGLYLLNVENGTIDLRSGELRPHRREDLLTKLINVPYDPGAQAPRWDLFLVEVTRGNVSLAEYLQRCIGYSLTGDVDEHIFFILYGSGANGKSTFVDTIKNMLAAYAGVIDKKTLIATPSSGVPNDVIKLQGLRFGAAAEIEVNSKLNESMLKDLTGGDDVTGRKLFKEYEDFAPQIKIWVSANYLPQIRGTDEGIWRRVRLIPFEARFEGKQRDKRLKERFRESELPGILAWAVRGAASWWRNKDLATPEVVKKATQNYRVEEDQVHQFIEEEYEVVGSLFEDHPHRVLKQDLYQNYQNWARRNGYRFPLTHPAFTKQLLTISGIHERRTHGQNYWYGLKSKAAAEKEF